MRWHAAKHPLDADVLIDIRPVNSLSGADNSPFRALSGRRFRKPPRPRQWHADNPAVNEIGRNGVGGKLDVSYTRFVINHNVHATLQ